MKMPTKLGAAGRRLWKDVTETYDLRPDEFRILEAASREVDLIAKMEKAMEGQSLTVTGSMGQTVAHPILSELRQHRAIVKSLLGSLRLPDDEAKPTPERSTSARAAAQARWRRGA